MRIKRIAAACVAAAVLTFGGLVLVSCGPDNEELVCQAVTEDLELVKTHDATLLEKLASKADAEGLAAYGIEPTAFLVSFLDGFDYRVDEVTVDGKTAQATVVLTCKSFDTFDSALSQSVASLSEGDGVANMGEEETAQLVGQAVMEALGSLEPVEKAPVKLDFTLKDNAWTPSADVERVIAGALFASA